MRASRFRPVAAVFLVSGMRSHVSDMTVTCQDVKQSGLRRRWEECLCSSAVPGRAREVAVLVRHEAVAGAVAGACSLRLAAHRHAVEVEVRRRVTTTTPSSAGEAADRHCGHKQQTRHCQTRFCGHSLLDTKLNAVIYSFVQNDFILYNLFLFLFVLFLFHIMFEL